MVCNGPAASSYIRRATSASRLKGHYGVVGVAVAEAAAAAASAAAFAARPSGLAAEKPVFVAEASWL